MQTADARSRAAGEESGMVPREALPEGNGFRQRPLRQSQRPQTKTAGARTEPAPPELFPGPRSRAGGSRGCPYADPLPSALEDCARFFIEEHEIDGLQRCFSAQVLRGLAQHDFRALFQRKAGDSGADGWESDCFQVTFSGDTQRVRRGTPQRRRRCAPAKLHARRVDDMTRLQLAASGDGSAAYRYTPDFVALALDFISALAPNRAGHASAEQEVVVGGVHDGVRVHFRQIALHTHDA